MTSAAACTILVVEDEAVVAMDLETNLERLGYIVAKTTDSGEEALEYVEKERPNRILMDIQPQGEMDGITAAQRIGEQFDLPVVFVTANTNEETIARAKKSGSYGFLSKPFRPNEQNATIEIALHQHQASQRLFTERGWLRTMLGSISDGVIATDADGLVRFLNPAAANLTGWSLVDALGKPIEQVYPLTHLNGDSVKDCQVRKALSSRKAIPKEQFLLHIRDDGHRAVEDAAAPIIEAGELIGAVTIFLDIADRLLREKKSVDERDKLSQQVQLTSAALGQSKEELQALSRHLMRVQEEEQGRIARELHDDLGQQAALLALQAGHLEKELPPESGARTAQIRSGLNALADGLRKVSHRLHPSIIADLGLSEALSFLVTEFLSQGLIVEASLAAIDEVPIGVSTSLYWIAQESLRNVQKHAPQCEVQMVLLVTEAEISLSISDDGPGFVLEDVRQRGGLGLISMQERARLIGGELLVTTKPGEGTTMLARVPWI